MARLVDVEPIVKFIKDGLNNPNKEETFGHTAVQILTELEYAPTVDAAPVVPGRFTNVQGLGDGTCVGFCSNCMTPHKANNLTALRIDYRYCRWCGAKMDGDTNE